MYILKSGVKVGSVLSLEYVETPPTFLGTVFTRCLGRSRGVVLWAVGSKFLDEVVSSSY